jgi:glycosyltransferase involved in cell wall biosynthesis
MTHVTDALVPRGGTELMVERLKAAIDPSYFDKVQLVVSKAEELDGRPAVLWVHDLPYQPGPQSALAPHLIDRYNMTVFVSHWQRMMFHMQFPKLELSRTCVIKNGIVPFPYVDLGMPFMARQTWDGPMIVLYASTPHRGLQFLPDIADRCKDLPVEFHVYSSLKLYGQPEADQQYEPLYERIRNAPNMKYFGTVSNSDLRDAMLNAHMLCYPCIYEETSCLTVMEAMAAGLAVIVPSLGALPETCAEYTFMYDFVNSQEVLVNASVTRIQGLVDHWSSESMVNRRMAQISYANQAFDFTRRVPAWKTLFKSIVGA